jgi:hypothetical protein
VSTTQGELVAKFAAGVVDTGGNLPPVSLTPVANFAPVLLTTVVHLDLRLRISPRIFKKIRFDPKVIIRGLGEGDSWKKPEAKNLVTLSLWAKAPEIVYNYTLRPMQPPPADSNIRCAEEKDFRLTDSLLLKSADPAYRWFCVPSTCRLQPSLLLPPTSSDTLKVTFEFFFFP